MCNLASFTKNVAKVNSPSESGSEAHSHLKENDPIRPALKIAVFDRLNILFLTLPMKNINQTFTDFSLRP